MSETLTAPIPKEHHHERDGLRMALKLVSGFPFSQIWRELMRRPIILLCLREKINNSHACPERYLVGIILLYLQGAHIELMNKSSIH